MHYAWHRVVCIVWHCIALLLHCLLNQFCIQSWSPVMVLEADVTRKPPDWRLGREAAAESGFARSRRLPASTWHSCRAAPAKARLCSLLSLMHAWLLCLLHTFIRTGTCGQGGQPKMASMAR